MKVFNLPFEKAIRKRFEQSMEFENKVVTPSSIVVTKKVNNQLEILFKIIRICWLGVSFIMILALSVLLISIF